MDSKGSSDALSVSMKNDLTSELAIWASPDIATMSSNFLGQASPCTTSVPLFPFINPPQETLDMSISPWSTSWCESIPIGTSHTKFEFLSKFTTTFGIANSFSCGSLRQRRQVAAIEGLDAEGTSDFDDVLQGSWSWEFSLRAELPHFPTEPNLSLSGLHEWARDPLVFKTQEIVDGLKETIQQKSRKSPITITWSKLIESTCLQSFNPANLRKFLRIFWCLWYPNCPIIHKPSFDPKDASACLLVSMAIIGSCLSPDERDNEMARGWFDAVEEMVFDDNWLDEDLGAATPFQGITGESQRLQSLQAAYFVCLYQNWEGSDSSKARVRRHRYNTLIAVC